MIFIDDAVLYKWVQGYIFFVVNMSDFGLQWSLKLYLYSGQWHRQLLPCFALLPRI